MPSSSPALSGAIERIPREVDLRDLLKGMKLTISIHTVPLVEWAACQTSDGQIRQDSPLRTTEDRLIKHLDMQCCTPQAVCTTGLLGGSPPGGRRRGGGAPSDLAPGKQ